MAESTKTGRGTRQAAERRKGNKDFKEQPEKKKRIIEEEAEKKKKRDGPLEKRNKHEHSNRSLCCLNRSRQSNQNNGKQRSKKLYLGKLKCINGKRGYRSMKPGDRRESVPAIENVRG